MKRLVLLVLALFMVTALCACGQKPVAEEQSVPSWQEQYDLGIRYLSEGNYQEAIIAFTAAIEIDPKQADAYLGLAEAHLQQQDTDRAREILQWGLEEVPDSEELKAKLQELEDLDSDYSRYVTDQLISEAEFTIGGSPFYEQPLETAIQWLPQSDPPSDIIELLDENDNPAVRRYDVFREGVGGIIMCEQRVSSHTLTGLMFSDYYHKTISGVETGIRDIRTGDSMESVLEKIGISAQGSAILAETGMSVIIGADHNLEGGYGWIETKENSVSVHGSLARMIHISMDTCTCQMDFLENQLVHLYVWVSHSHESSDAEEQSS